MPDYRIIYDYDDWELAWKRMSICQECNQFAAIVTDAFRGDESWDEPEKLDKWMRVHRREHAPA